MKGLMTVVLETFLLEGGEKDVCTGCGKLGGSDTCKDAVPSGVCDEGESGADFADVFEILMLLDDDGIRDSWLMDLRRALVEAVEIDFGSACAKRSFAPSDLGAGASTLDGS